MGLLFAALLEGFCWRYWCAIIRLFLLFGVYVFVGFFLRGGGGVGLSESMIATMF